MNIYNLSTEMIILQNRLLDTIDDETGEVDAQISEALNVTNEKFLAACEGMGAIYRSISNTVETVAAEIERLKRLKSILENRQEKVKTAIDDAMQRTGTIKIDGIRAKLSYRKSIVTIVDKDHIEELPERFIIKTEKKPNLTEIKNAIENGEQVPFSHLEEKQNLQIK